jgi:hypothetical protein
MGVQLPRLLRLRLLLSAASASGFKTQPLLKSGQTRDKQPIAYPKTDKPEIISVIGIIEPGGRTPLHEHPVPIYVYILEGEWNCRVTGDSRINTKPARHTSRLSITSKSRSSAARRRGRSPDGDARTAVSQVEGRS